MTKPKTAGLLRRKPVLNREQVEAMRKEILRVLAIGPRTTTHFTERFKLSKWAMSKYMAGMRDAKLVHSVRMAGVGAAQPYMWHLGAGEHTVVPLDEGLNNTEREELVRRVIVTKWPPVKIPKQGIFAALGL